MVSRPSVVTVSSFGRQKLIENMMRVSVYAFKQVIVSFLKEFCYSLGFRSTVIKFLENVDTVESLLLSQEAKPESEKFHVRWGIHRTSVLQIIHKNLHLNAARKGALNS